jgi:hypothetical protein
MEPTREIYGRRLLARQINSLSLIFLVIPASFFFLLLVLATHFCALDIEARRRGRYSADQLNSLLLFDMPSFIISYFPALFEWP